ncbi:hypothetical protein EJB05_22808, partial [Eragrostis curvula]
MPLSAETIPRCILDPSQAPANKVQSDSIQVHWQPVRERYWWRRKKGKINYFSPSTIHHNSAKFKEKVGDPCFNCLTRGHKVAQCRDPPKCWKCRSSGHISSCCTSKASSKRLHFPNADDPHGDRRPRINETTHGTFRWSDDETKGISHASNKLDCGRGGHNRESSCRKEIRDRGRSLPLLRFSEPRGERKASHLLWRSKEKSTNRLGYSADIMEVPSSYNNVTGTHAGLEQLGRAARSAAPVIQPDMIGHSSIKVWTSGLLQRDGKKN